MNKLEFWAARGIDGMPKDKQKLAEAAWNTAIEYALQTLKCDRLNALVKTVSDTSAAPDKQ